uniref:Uncharacterized protein n=1 Tax=Eptatretus burgeri TaxID=7764 RepID=A0A8C4PWI4_EPTBU
MEVSVTDTRNKGQKRSNVDAFDAKEQNKVQIVSGSVDLQGTSHIGNPWVVPESCVDVETSLVPLADSERDTENVLEQLLPEMCSLLELLEQEQLSAATQTCRDAVLKLLRQLKPSDAEETEYIYTSSAACNNGMGLWQVLEQCWRPAAIKTEPARGGG